MKKKFMAVITTFSLFALSTGSAFAMVSGMPFSTQLYGTKSGNVLNVTAATSTIADANWCSASLDIIDRDYQHHYIGETKDYQSVGQSVPLYAAVYFHNGVGYDANGAYSEHFADAGGIDELEDSNTGYFVNNSLQLQ